MSTGMHALGLRMRRDRDVVGFDGDRRAVFWSGHDCG